jgi:hypothetical protein
MNQDSSSFPLKIKGSETVGDLKVAIQASKPGDLGGVDADRLHLYKVNVPDSGDLKERVLQIPRQELQELRVGSEVLSVLFPKNPPTGTVSILVRDPGIHGEGNLTERC